MTKERNPKLKIAVVDDSDLSRRTVVEVLEKEGFDVVGQLNSAEAAIKFAANNPATNLFLIDVVMPEVSGIELAKHISDNTMDTFIVMMSSLGMENIVIESISNGAVDFLEKPFSPVELLSSVEKIEKLLGQY
ncbi:MAG: response regulator [Halobacteriovoraceae bacterium]|jgi:two-component system, chemotaxis family, chemotaxis protein CheY|nr:response regulator [Halobacteriovoraceae bacterium]MBT5093341.1 response regulator [Halobacteriovoraceae bacterium]